MRLPPSPYPEATPKEAHPHTEQRKETQQMTTIKPTIPFILPLILAALLITSCSDYDNDYTVNQIRYEKAFLDAFGEIDPAQDWNLVKQLDKQGRSTRGAVTDAIYNRSRFPDLAYPADLTDDQRTIVRLYFQYNKYAKKVSFNYSDFYVQQIYFGGADNVPGRPEDCPEVYYAADGTKLRAVDNCMSELAVWDGSKYTEVNNFNSGIRNDAIMYMEGVQSMSFTYTNNGTGKHWLPVVEQIIVSGEAIDHWAENNPDILKLAGITNRVSVAESVSKYNDGQTITLPRYYLGFDYMLYEGKDDDLFVGTITILGQEFPVINNPNQCGGDMIVVNNYSMVLEILEHPERFNENQRNDCAEDVEKLKYCMANGYYPFGDTGKWVKPASIRDGYYSDWIICVTPGKPHNIETLESALLICEDLGSQDFDFNDIVLKLEHKRMTTPATTEGEEEKTTDKLIITSMAAGGTLPAYVYYKPLRQAASSRNNEVATDSLELWTWLDFANGNDDITNCVHDMWAQEDLSGQTSFIPLNVGQIFEREGHSWSVDVTDAVHLIATSDDIDEETGNVIRDYKNSYVSYIFDFARIRIYVGEDRDETKLNQIYIAPIIHGISEDEDRTSAYKTSNVPQMILVPENFEWPIEENPIAEAYPYFRDWVRNMVNTNWYTQKRSESDVTSRYDSNGGGNGGNSGGNTDDSGNGNDNGKGKKISPRTQYGAKSSLWNGEWKNENPDTHVVTVEAGSSPFTIECYNNDGSKNYSYSIVQGGENFIRVSQSGNNFTVTPLQEGEATLWLTVPEEFWYSTGADDYYYGEVKIKVIIKVTPKTEDPEPEKPKGDEKYSEYGTPIGNYETPSVSGKIYTTLGCLIDVKKELPESGNITISVVYECGYPISSIANAPIGGLYWDTSNIHDPHWELKKEKLDISLDYIGTATPAYNVITIKCNAADMRELYDYLNCKVYEGTCKGAYWKADTSAKRRTTRR